ncbi:LysR family transcriptional regulator [Rhodobacteraceae bacterium RKSG542]|uniref:LysR family transcriptional regulator n=1 Tax=Pseudovibrio flavus TaxID=2529854 RepID=UPI0012BD5E90|nr:LysR family transcriptional regulator [Pseudovibrio flavus]MTI19068.1 LysR family transcriptional regulator [Pseudovibrio flavus]
MEWKNIGFDWNHARAFYVTAEQGSLSAASRALGLTQPTLGRQVTALEEELGVTLFARIGNKLQLTPAGQELLGHLKQMAEAAARFSISAAGTTETLDGKVTISASEVYAFHLLPPIIKSLRESYPNMEFEIIASNALSDIRKREADIAIRNARPSDPELIARNIGEDEAYLYASPAYLQRAGTPQTPEDLQQATMIGFDNVEILLKGLNDFGLPVTRESFKVLSASHLIQWQMIKNGAGIGVMTKLLGDSEPQVTRVLEEFTSIRYPIWLVTHRDLKTTRRYRLVFDHLVKSLKALI